MRTTELDYKNSEVPSEQYLTNLLQVGGSLEERHMGTLEMLNLELTVLGHLPKCQASHLHLYFQLGLTSPFFPKSSLVVIHLFLQQIIFFIPILGKALC